MITVFVPTGVREGGREREEGEEGGGSKVSLGKGGEAQRSSDLISDGCPTNLFLMAAVHQHRVL